MDSLVERLNTTYFDGRMSPAAMGALAGLPEQSAEMQAVAERMCKYMRVARLGAVNFSDSLAFLIGTIFPGLVPGAWGGKVPPITTPGRHEKIDAYIDGTPWREATAEPTLLDVGCGFPPATTVETATRLPSYRITGLDPLLPYYIVFDELGDYATFDQEGQLEYFQAGIPDAERYAALLKDPAATVARFTGLQRQLLASLPESDTETLATVEQDGARLVKYAVGEYERPNLSFRRGAIGDGGIVELDIVRCFNVLMYFDRPFRQEAVDWAGAVLKPGGVFLCGVNWHRSLESRYSVYRREGARIVAKEFAFSVENIRPFTTPVPWYALHDDEYDTGLLAQLVGLLRSHDTFRQDFDTRLDQLLAERGLFDRDEAGYLRYTMAGMTPEVMELGVEVGEHLDREGYVERAVAVLQQSGYTAWRNCVGHVAIDPTGIEVPPLS